MNYIKGLEARIKELEAQREQAQEQVTEFLVHLSGPKFYEDTTIQTRDVQTRLMELRSALA